MDGITWEEFLKDIKVIYDISQRLNDNWELISAVSKCIVLFHLKSLTLIFHRISCVLCLGAYKNIQNDDIAGSYLVKKSLLWLAIDEETDENNGRDVKEDDLLSYESPAKETVNHDAKPKQLIKFEYHVLYHMSYAVPYLCFNAHKSSRFSKLRNTEIELKHGIPSKIELNSNNF